MASGQCAQAELSNRCDRRDLCRAGLGAQQNGRGSKISIAVAFRSFDRPYGQLGGLSRSLSQGIYYRLGIAIMLVSHSLNPIRSIDRFAPFIPLSIRLIARKRIGARGSLSRSLFSRLIPSHNQGTASSIGIGYRTQWLTWHSSGVQHTWLAVSYRHSTPSGVGSRDLEIEGFAMGTLSRSLFTPLITRYPLA